VIGRTPEVSGCIIKIAYHGHGGCDEDPCLPAQPLP
jgi:hypothetical protein